MKKAIICIALAVLLTASPSWAFQNEPDGFRGIKWGTNLDDTPDFEYQEFHTQALGLPKGLTKVYTRRNENLKIGYAKITGVFYVCYSGKFFSVMISLRGNSNLDSLMSSLEQIYGEGTAGSASFPMVDFKWSGASVDVALDWDLVREEGFLYYCYTPIREKLENHLKKEAAKKAADDL